jgi:hypothetical protein
MKALISVAIAAVLSLATAQAQSPSAGSGGQGLVGAWHLVRINVHDSDGPDAPNDQPLGMLIYTSDGHMSVQLMYRRSASSPDNEYVLGGYEASFGSYDVDEAKHIVTHHVQGSITRDLLVGKDLPRVYQVTDDGHLIIRPADPQEHWSVIWERY